MTEAAVANAPVRRKPGPKPGTKPSTQAKNNPVSKPGKELLSADIPQTQPPDISLAFNKPIEHETSIEAIDKPLESDYAQALLMAEDPITIQIEPGQDENAPRVVDCWVNGKGAEVLDPRTGKWMELNCLPIGGPITTKRKYVEVLARAKFDNIQTKTGDMTQELPENRIVRNTGRKAVFSVLEDRNPKGRDWLVRLMSER
jgi:hypothetical protein